MPLAAGERLGPFEVLGPLGAGGMGVVYRARDPRLGRAVAIKVLPDEFSRDPARLERFTREARALGALSHPNILAVHDVGSQSGRPYVVFELLEGETLRERLAQGRIPVAPTLDLGLQIVRGLAAAHQQGVVHRDLKPENLFVLKDGRLKILDFGLAKVADGPEERRSHDVTASGAVLGTCGYMAPEQLRGEPADTRSDVFAFGTVLHEMLAGDNPFRRATAVETQVAILKEAPPPLPVELTSQAPGLQGIVTRCLANAPEDRFQSTRDLEFALQQLTTAAGSAPLPQPPVQPSQRPRLWIGTALLALAGLTAGILSDRRTPPPPVFRKLTARPGTISAARFSADGNTVLMTARWAERPWEVLEQRLDALEARAVGLPVGRVLAQVAGEVALLTSPHWRRSGSLVRAPISGGPARGVAEGVRDADWARDGSAFAVVRVDDARARLEYPLGRKLYESPGLIADPRISPDGRSVAFLEHPVRGHDAARIVVVDDAGALKLLTESPGVLGLDWSPDGREVWFTGCVPCGSGGGIEAVTVSGRRRVLLSAPSDYRLVDVGPDGSALLLAEQRRRDMAGWLAGDDREQDLSFMDATFLMDLSADGRTVLFADVDRRVGRLTAYLRRAQQPQPTRLDLGEPQSLSPDGKWITLRRTREADSLAVIPADAGEAVTLPRGTIADYYNSRWLPDGRHVLIAAQEQGRPKRLFLQRTPDGQPRPVTPEGVMNMYPAISPDGRWVAAGPERDGALQAAWPLGGGEPKPLSGLSPGDWVVRWSSDGRFVFAYDIGRADPPWQIFRVDLETGRREVWKELEPADPSGLHSLSRVHVTPDGRFYAYTFVRIQSELYLVTGLR